MMRVGLSKAQLARLGHDWLQSRQQSRMSTYCIIINFMNSEQCRMKNEAERSLIRHGRCALI